MIPGYARVTRSRRCPICHKPDWCLIATDGSSAICPRVWEGCKREMGEAGFLHVIDESTHARHATREAVYIPPPEPLIDAEFLAGCYERAIDGKTEQLTALSRELGISEAALQSFRIGWSADHGAWSFPMVDERQRAIGIRLRKPDGFKFCVKGSRTGLFIPVTFDWTPSLFITEGPTDAGAILDMGFDAIARPDCRSNVDRIVNFIQQSPRKTLIVIVADTDTYGRAGAYALADQVAFHRPTKVIFPLIGKDIRQWKQHGARAESLMAVVKNTPLIAKEPA
jgi:hypothetical protein